MTLRTRIAAVASLSVALAVLAAAVGLYVAVRSDLRGEIDKALNERAQAVPRARPAPPAAPAPGAVPGAAAGPARARRTGSGRGRAGGASARAGEAAGPR